MALFLIKAHRLAVLEIAKNVNPFTFALFEKRIGQESRKLTASGITDYLTSELSRQFRPNEVNMASASIVVKCFDDYIDQLRGNDQASTANNYLSALKAFLRFYIDRHGTGTPFHFDHITPDFLRAFQRAWKSGGFSPTSVSMYARAFRTIYRRGSLRRDMRMAVYIRSARKIRHRQTKGAPISPYTLTKCNG